MDNLRINGWQRICAIAIAIICIWYGLSEINHGDRSPVSAFLVGGIFLLGGLMKPKDGDSVLPRIRHANSNFIKAVGKIAAFVLACFAIVIFGQQWADHAKYKADEAQMQLEQARLAARLEACKNPAALSQGKKDICNSLVYVNKYDSLLNH